MPRFVQAGALRHRVAIQVVTEAKDAHGKEKQTWATSQTVWGAVVPLAGRELELAQRFDARVNHRVDLRINSVIASRTRIIHKTRTLNVLYVLDVQERGIKTQAFCEEVVP